MIELLHMDQVCEAISEIRSRMADAASRAGRSATEIELMAVSKTVDRDQVAVAYRCGIRLFGENRVAEASDKFDPPFEDTRLHLIGHLQRNKAKEAAGTFSCVESIDKLSTAEALARHLPTAKLPFPILIEVNTSHEPTKHGVVEPDDLDALVENILSTGSFRIDGLMTIAPFTDDEKTVRSAFALLRESIERLRTKFSLDTAQTLSMGMSGDFEWAIEEGATRVRVGTAIFGARRAQ